MKKMFIIILLGFVFANTFEYKLELFQRLMSIEEYDRAVSVAEEIFSRWSDEPEAANVIVAAYRAKKDYKKLAEVLENILLKNPNDFQRWAEIGEAYLAIGNSSKAFDAFSRATQIAPKNEQLVLRIYDVLLQWGYLEECIKLLNDYRKRIGDKSIFAMELARIYEIQSDFASAVGEYAKYLTKHPDRFSEVENRIDIAGKDTTELAKLGKSLMTLFDTSVPQFQVWRLLSRLSARLSKWDEAYELLRKSEDTSPEKVKGSAMMTFVDDMIRREQFAVALKGSEYLIAMDKYRNVGLLYKAKALRGLKKSRQAISTINDLINPEAKLIIAQIYLEDLKIPDSSEFFAREFVSAGGEKSYSADAISILAKVSLLKGDTRKAISVLFVPAQSQVRDDIIFLLALAYLVSGDVDSASIFLDLFLRRFPQSNFANDGVALKLILQDHKDGIAYSRVLLSMILRDSLRASYVLDSLISVDMLSSVRDMALWQLALCQKSVGNKLYVNSINTLLEKFPQSVYAPMGLELLADDAMGENNFNLAKQLFSQIVDKYPDAMNIGSVRDKLRRLEMLSQ